MPTRDMKEAFSSAYDQFADDIFRYAYSRTGNREVAKDIAQDTFMKTWVYIAGGGHVDHMKAFLFHTARNLIIDSYRKKKEVSLDRMIEVGIEPAGGSGEEVERNVELECMLAQMAKLDEPAREILTLRYVNGLELDEIADLLDTSKNVVSVRINRAMESLRKLLHI